MAILGPLVAMAVACAPAYASDVGGKQDGAGAPQIIAAPSNLSPLSPAAGLTQPTLQAGVSLPASAIPGANAPGAAAPLKAAAAAAAATAAASPSAAAKAPVPKAKAAPPAPAAPAAGTLENWAAGAAHNDDGASTAGAGAHAETEALAHGDADAAAAAGAQAFDNAAKALGTASQTPQNPEVGDTGKLSPAEILIIAENLGPFDAPGYYSRAIGAAMQLPAGERGPMIKTISKAAEKRAPLAVTAAIYQALDYAKRGRFNAQAQAAYTKAVTFWNGALEHAKDTPLKDPASVLASLQFIQSQAEAGKDAKGWDVSFTKLLAEQPFKLQVNFTQKAGSEPQATAASPLQSEDTVKIVLPTFAPTFKQRFAQAREAGRGYAGAFVAASLLWAKDAVPAAWAKTKSWARLFWHGERREDDFEVHGVDEATLARLRESLGPDEIALYRPRARVFNHFGYRVRHAMLPGVEGRLEADHPVVLKVGHGGTPEQLTALRKRFDTFNRLIEANFAALELIAQNPHAMTVKQGKAVLDRVQAMARAFLEIAGVDDKVARKEAQTVRDLGSRLGEVTQGLSDGDPLPPAALELIVPLEKKSLHRSINTLHQLALERVGRVGAEGSANFFLWLKRADRNKQVALVDLSNDPLIKDGRVVSPGLKALTEALAKASDTPNGSLIMQDHQFWGHFKLGAHSAEIYANFLPPDEGGMIRVRYQEWGTDIYNEARLYYVARTLEFLGFTVNSDNGFLTAVVDKDHRSQTADQMRESFSMIVQALHATVGLDFALPIILQGSTTSEESGRRIDEWVKIVLAEGGLPFYERDQHENMVRGFREYRDRSFERSKIENAVEDELKRLGLPEMPLDENMGQRTLDKRFNEVVERALARGELLITPDGRLNPVKDHDPLRVLAGELSRESAAAARMGEAVSSLDPGLFEYQTLGSIGGLTVQRAQRRLDSDTWLNVYALRDPQTGQIGLARAELGTLTGPPRPVGPEKVFALLAEQGHPVAAFTPSNAPAGMGLYLRKLRQAPNPSTLSAPELFSGLAASPGPGRSVTAKVTFDKKVAASQPRIFAAPYTDPDDLDAIRNAKAVVTTSGGLLSHAAITTREMGIGAVILGQAAWRDGALVLKLDEFSPSSMVSGLHVRRVAKHREVTVKEGDVIRVDPATGQVETYPEELHPLVSGVAVALASYDSGATNGARLAEFAKTSLGPGKLTEKQRQALARELLGALASRVAAKPEAAADARAVRAALRAGADASLKAYLARVEEVLFNTERAAAMLQLRDLGEQVNEAASLPGVERLSTAAAVVLDKIRRMAYAFQRPEDDLGLVQNAYFAAKRVVDQRSERLLQADIEELEEHARLYPSVTADALPKLKALVAKAKRRKLAPHYYQAWEAQIGKLEGSRRVKRMSAAPVALSLKDVLDTDVLLVGGKGAKLGEIAEVVKNAGGKTAPGVALTVQAYRDFLRVSGIEAAVGGLAARTDLSAEERSAKIQSLIRGAKLTKDSALGQAIAQQLKAAGLEGQMLAVRSSAVDEDGAAAAFAGAGDTHLYATQDEVLDRVKEVWASLYNPRALLYRESKGLAMDNLAQAVVVQMMVPSEVSGVAFTEDPVSGNTGRVVVNAAFGLGEGIVSGRVAPDQYVLSKRSGREILPAMISDKKIAVVRGKSGKGSEEQRTAPEKRRARSLSPAQLEKLSTVATALENHFGYALDIEFAFVGNELYILQARAVTTADVSPAPPQAPAPVKPPEAAPIMFVCTGNTCRSPMAAVMLRQELEDLKVEGQPVASRGINAEDGQPISEGSANALAERGMSAGDHRSATLTAADVASARLILVMSQGHKDAILKSFPQAKGKVHLLTEYAGQEPKAIADPYGKDAAVYEATAHEIEQAVGRVAQRLADDLKVEH